MHVPSHAHGGIPLVPLSYLIEEVAEWALRRNHTDSDNDTQDIIDWQSAGFNMNRFQGWWWPKFNATRQPPYLILPKYAKFPKGSICFKKDHANGTYPVGISQCNQTLIWQPPITNLTRKGLFTFDWSAVKNQTSGGPWRGEPTRIMMTDDKGNLSSYNDTYFVCGHKAYPWLPENWSGSCYMGFVVPGIAHYTDLSNHPHARSTRSIVPWEAIATVLWPQFGSIRSLQKVNQLRDILEQVANDTAEGLSELSAELVAVRTVALQNRMALDYLLASKGGTCAVVGSECCTYIPDSSENITHLVDHIRDGVKRLRQSSSDDWRWLWSSSWTTYLFHGFIFFIAICILLCIIITCVKCFCNRLGASVMPQMLQWLSQLDPQDLARAENVYEDVELDFPEAFFRLSRISF
ncbi:endogenous retrovirus group PABLB member 1 Env polyprotein-like [Scyliorhinus canicula]|uniref:endogenous retrovirus group PABLB member 1 Env polyprotein-like n=1 Tax=Scyliorhinus canicula TaxID=7830 RepID=UPI0018F5FF78|nr:endogenous retrovirus group PABLB member 1 Env polyprotein-like [Scyliorhinus canicula]